MKILLIDNYDSFTFNVKHHLSEMGAKVNTFRNDAISMTILQYSDYTQSQNKNNEDIYLR